MILNAMPSENGSLKNNSVFLIILTKIAILSAKFYYHIPFDMVHHTDP